MWSYYRRFIAKFSAIAGPLHDLTKKNVKYVWTDKERKAFTTLKERLTSQPVLVLPDLSKPFEVHCDASGDCLGAVLLQEGDAIAYENRRLHSDEQSLDIYEKELLAVMHALDTWKHYLLGTPFIIRTDHQSLKYFMTRTKISNKQLRWENFISQFNFYIAHILGNHNQVADALSRIPRCNAVSVASHNDLTIMDFFARLQTKKDELEITDIHVSLTTLEEVFIHVAMQAELEAALAEGLVESLTLSNGTTLSVPVGAPYVVVSGAQSTGNPNGLVIELSWHQDESGRLSVVEKSDSITPLQQGTRNGGLASAQAETSTTEVERTGIQRPPAAGWSIEL
ncbi:hypothetical protein L7F22_066943 [Adiantum nelumboides]|nr:hypothetical protein [Adiantum nelumboides]